MLILNKKYQSISFQYFNIINISSKRIQCNALYFAVCIEFWQNFLLWWTVTHSDSALECHAKATYQVLNICKSRFHGWWNKGKSGGINSSNCLLQKSMEVSGSRSLHRVLAALPKCKRPCGVGTSCLSEQCHMNKHSEMGNRRKAQWVSHLPGLNWLLGSFPPFKSFRSQF